MVTVFTGNSPSNVSKTAKYSVRSGKAGNPDVIGLVYDDLVNGERWFASTEEHPDLVAMVNAVKLEINGQPRGSFYINEYGQVLVPDADGTLGGAAYAGEYRKAVEFEFEGNLLSSDPVDLDGNLLEAGAEWKGARQGVAYTLAAGGNDIYYKTTPRPNVQKKVTLSRAAGAKAAQETSRQVCSIVGPSGGRFYVNEAMAMFAPGRGENYWQPVYIGQLDLDFWFPKPIL